MGAVGDRPTGTATGMSYGDGFNTGGGGSAFSTNTSSSVLCSFIPAANNDNPSNIGMIWFIINLHNNGHGGSNPEHIQNDFLADANGLLLNSGKLRYFGNYVQQDLFTPRFDTNIDVLMAITPTNVIWYTNGQPALTNTTPHTERNGQGGFGNLTTAYYSFQGKIVEWFGAWFYPAQSDVDALHKYGTNTYNYWP